MSSPTRVPFQQHGEPPRHASILSVPVPLENYSDREKQLIGTLSLATYHMNAIYQLQCCPDTPLIRQTLGSMLPQANPEQQLALRNYLTILLIQNGPYALVPRKNHLLDMNPEEAQTLAQEAGVQSAFEKIRKYLFESLEVPSKVNFYPSDLTQEEYDALPKSAALPNTCVVRDASGAPQVVPFEQIYACELQPVIELLAKARGLSENASFQLYLDAKICELRTGSEESRRLVDSLWVRHTSPIDLLLSTGLETYLDCFQGVTGSACAAVLLKNQGMQSLLDRIVEKVPQLERSAPWDALYQRSEENVRCHLPELKFVDVCVWSGDFVTAPGTILAQSLPNDQWVMHNVGTVNMVYYNTNMALHALNTQELASLFLSPALHASFHEDLVHAGQLQCALHEIGHTMGCQHPEFSSKEPNEYLGPEYSWLEELRAECYSVVSAHQLSTPAFNQVLTHHEAQSCLIALFLDTIQSLKQKPEQAHHKARLAWFHAMQEHHGITITHTEANPLHFDLNFDGVLAATQALLAQVQEIKAQGNREAARLMREKYCLESTWKDLVEEKTSHFTRGCGLMFPVWQGQGQGDGTVACVGYAGCFEEQPLF